MMKKMTLVALSLLAAVSMTSCNAIEKLTQRELEIPDLTIDLECQLTRAGAALNYTHTFNLDDEAFADIKAHIGWVREVDFERIEISGPAGTSVTDMVFTAKIDGTTLSTFTVASHNFNEPYSSAAADTFVKKVLDQIIARKSVTLSVTGTTDLTEGNALDLKLKVIDPVITAGLDL